MYSHFVIGGTLSSAGTVDLVHALDVISRSADGPDLVLWYGDHSDARIDVFLPPSPPSPAAAPLTAAPLAVVLHGGFWREEWDRVHLRPMAQALSAAGFVVATPEYRRGSGRWQAMSVDIEVALAAVAGLVGEAAPGLIDAAAPLVLAGHSAGGHLALWSGLRAGPDVVRRIVALAPVSDVYWAARSGMGSDAARDLLGGSPDEVPVAYADADAVRLLPGDVPVTLIQGDDDKQVTVDMNRQLAADLEAADDGTASFTYVELAGVDHFALIDPESDAWSTVLGALTSPS